MEPGDKNKLLCAFITAADCMHVISQKDSLLKTCNLKNLSEDDRKNIISPQQLISREFKDY